MLLLRVAAAVGNSHRAGAGGLHTSGIAQIWNKVLQQDAGAVQESRGGVALSAQLRRIKASELNTKHGANSEGDRLPVPPLDAISLAQSSLPDRVTIKPTAGEDETTCSTPQDQLSYFSAAALLSRTESLLDPTTSYDLLDIGGSSKQMQDEPGSAATLFLISKFAFPLAMQNQEATPSQPVYFKSLVQPGAVEHYLTRVKGDACMRKLSGASDNELFAVVRVLATRSAAVLAQREMACDVASIEKRVDAVAEISPGLSAACGAAIVHASSLSATRPGFVVSVLRYLHRTEKQIARQPRRVALASGRPTDRNNSERWT